VNEVPPSQDSDDEADDLYRRASALDPSRPGEAVRRRVLEHAAQLASPPRRWPDSCSRRNFSCRMGPARPCCLTRGHCKRRPLLPQHRPRTQHPCPHRRPQLRHPQRRCPQHRCLRRVRWPRPHRAPHRESGGSTRLMNRRFLRRASRRRACSSRALPSAMPRLSRTPRRQSPRRMHPPRFRA
jgi:hypothetical protein